MDSNLSSASVRLARLAIGSFMDDRDVLEAEATKSLLGAVVESRCPC